MLEALKGYKTVLFNSICALLAVWRYARPQDQVPDDSLVAAMIDGILNSLEAIMIVGNIGLRFRTDTTIFKSQ